MDFQIENGVLKAYQGAGGDIVIPDGVHTIGARAFANNEAITGVTIPEGVVRIEAFAFYGCNNLKTLAFPESLRVVDSTAFLGYREIPSVTAQGVYATGIEKVIAASRADYRYKMCSNCKYRVYCAAFDKYFSCDECGSERKNGYLCVHKTRSYLAETSDHESGQDLYEDEYISRRCPVPDAIPDDEVLLYTFSHFEDWESECSHGDLYF